MRIQRILIIGFLAAIFSAAAYAQTITATIRGTVTDPSGAIIAGANITATNVNTGVATRTVTNGAGSYNIQFLPIGEYTVSATAPGFSLTSAGPYALQIDQIANVNLLLKVGHASTMVKVGAGQAPLLNTENSTLGTSISSHMLLSMPLNGLNAYTATMMVPGTVLPTIGSLGGLQGSFRNSFLNKGGQQPSEAVPSFNGNRQQSNNYVLDGIEINETVNNSIGYNPSPFSIQEMRVITGNADAEFGNVNGGEVLMVTKGGTNQFHGDAYEYWENSAITANTWANNYTGTAKQRFNQHLFGGDVGGPILRNKLFFFADYEGLRYRVPTSEGSAGVPDARERTGDFSELLSVEGLQLYNTSNGLNNATPYVNNQIPIVNPVAQYLFSNPSALPLPNHTPDPGTVTGNNYRGPVSSFNNNNQADLRIDLHPENNDSVMIKGTWGDAYDGGTENPLPTSFVSGDDFPFDMVSLGWVHTFSPSVVNDARVGFSRIIARLTTISDPSGIFGTRGNALVGIPLPYTQSTVGFTNMQAGSDELSNYGTPPGAGNQIVDNNFIYDDTVTWHHGNHNTKFGAQFVRYQQNYVEVGNQGGALGFFAYSGVYTAAEDSPGYSFADFVLDKATNSQIAAQTGFFGQRQWRTAYFVQDDWKALPNLTVNLGMRYSYNQPIYEVNNKMLSVDLNKARFNPDGDPESFLLFAGQDGNSRALYNPTYTEWQPRVGFALMLSPRMVLRGGYGITTALEGTGNGLRMTQNPPFLTTLAQGANPPDATTGGTALSVQNGFGTSGSGSSNYAVWSPKLRPAMVQQFNLNLQMQTSDHTSFQVGYVGQVGDHLAVPAAINQWTGPLPAGCDADPDAPNCLPAIVPFYSLVGPNNQVIETISEGISNYNALQASIQHQESNGLTFQLHYTLAKSLTNNAGGFFTTDGVAGADSFWQNVYNPMGDYGPSDFDVRHNLVGTAVYELPFGRNKRFGAGWNRGVDEILGGWKLSGTLFMSSGLPVTLRVNPNCSTNCPGLLDYIERPNKYGNFKVTNRSTQNWFGTDPSVGPVGGCTTPGVSDGTCAYGIPSPDSFGTASPGTERAPGQRLIDLSASKSFTTFQDQTITFRTDAFNAFNMASYGAPFNRVGSSLFGKIRSTLSPPRQLQLSLVYKF